MANDKYDNLTVMMSSGQLNWVADPINAVLLQGAVFDATDKTLSEVGAPLVAAMPVPGRSVDPTGALLGGAVSFGNLLKDTPYQVVLTKQTGPGVDPLLISYYDVDDAGQPFTLVNNGTLIVRPTQATPGPGPGTWVSI